MSGIKGSGNRPKTAKHLRASATTKRFTDSTQEERERRHRETDVWAERIKVQSGAKPAEEA